MTEPNSVCPKCGMAVVMVAVENKRNGNWTAVPLDKAEGEAVGNFKVLNATHEAWDILKVSLGELPVGVYDGEFDSSLPYLPHPPSHYLEPNEHTH